MQFFVTGTSTEVGKTYVTCQLLRHYHSRYPSSTIGAVKPFESGYDTLPHHERDVTKLAAASTPSGVAAPYLGLQAPLSPLHAAQQENISIDFQEALAWVGERVSQWQVTLCEGAGGLMVPITQGLTFLDFAHALGWPVIVVARNTLGVINHTALTVDRLVAEGLTVAGVILNNFPSDHPAPHNQVWLQERYRHVTPVLSATDAALQNYVASWGS